MSVSNNIVELDYMADVSSAAENVPSNLHLFDRLPLKTWDPIGEVKGRSFSERVAIASSSDHHFKRIFMMMKSEPWKRKFVYDDPALLRLLAAESIHAFHGLLMAKFSAETGSTLPTMTRKRAFVQEGDSSGRQDILVVIDSDQLVDLFNILAGLGSIKMMAKDFADHHETANKTYDIAFNQAMELILNTWKNKAEFFNAASAMKTAYTSAMLGSYEVVANYPGMQLLIGPVKRQMISSLSTFSLQRAREVLLQSEAKAPTFMASLKPTSFSF